MKILAALLVFLISGFHQAPACIHVPLTYEGSVTYSTEEFFMYHDGKNAHMIIKPTIQVGSAAPESLGWIIPVPSLPVDYKEADADIFKSLFDFVEDHQERAVGCSARGELYSQEAVYSKGLVLYEKKTVGNYVIQPIELKSVDSGKELLDWLNQNGFKTKIKDISYYLKRKYFYLAIKITGLSDGEQILKPLDIIYDSNTLTVPLKFDYLSGIFDVNVYLLVKDQLTDSDIKDFESKGLLATGAKLDCSGPISHMSYDFNFSPGERGYDKFVNSKLPSGYLYKFHGDQINSKDNSLESWADDPEVVVNQ